MKLIKLDATASSNSFLKDLSQSTSLEDFTVVVTKQQTSGRGQMQTQWVSESGKNLTFSVFAVFGGLEISSQKYLNFAVSVAVYQTLLGFNLPKLSIKWPNDILSEKEKICGVLIENSLQGNLISSSIIGIGLNVNQTDFPPEINATSMQLKLKSVFNLDSVLQVLLDNLKKNLVLLSEKQYSVLEQNYLAVLHQKNIPTMFKDSQDRYFMGKIIGVCEQGKLLIELSDETIKPFGLKEVSFAKL